ncbi:hypothetical protein [Yoonia sp. 208BN28-4]|uniref:hypothetical protein n=1 Tax=Yoonia sp. 208BN28-4 TaxID=3126505 RepID=UPI0030AAD0EF
MDWPNIIAELGRLIDIIGIFGLVLILAAALIGWSIYWNRRNGNRSTGQVVADAVTPMTCKWSDVDRDQLAAVVQKVDNIQQVQKQMDRELIRVSERIDARH